MAAAASSYYCLLAVRTMTMMVILLCCADSLPHVSSAGSTMGRIALDQVRSW
jgi:hypothetical protein